MPLRSKVRPWKTISVYEQFCEVSKYRKEAISPATIIAGFASIRYSPDTKYNQQLEQAKTSFMREYIEKTSRSQTRLAIRAIKGV